MHLFNDVSHTRVPGILMIIILGVIWVINIPVVRKQLYMFTICKQLYYYLSHVPWDNKSHLQKQPGPKVLSFSWNFALRGIHTYNDTHYEIIGVDE